MIYDADGEVIATASDDPYAEQLVDPAVRDLQLGATDYVTVCMEPELEGEYYGSNYFILAARTYIEPMYAE